MWPPQYKIKQHAFVRQVKLKISTHHGLEILVPKRFSLRNIAAILEENKCWIEKSFKKMQLKKIEEVEEFSLPVVFDLQAIKQTWKIMYEKTTAKKLQLLIRPNQELVLLGNIDNKEAAKKILENWLKSQASVYLIPILHNLSQQLQLSFKDVTIRRQKYRWGSCSSEKTISLNYRILFLPVSLMQHILIHELCHTLHLNHSTLFWELVAKHDPNWKEHHQLLKQTKFSFEHFF